MGTQRDSVKARTARRRPGPVEQAVRSQLRAEGDQLHANGQAKTARAASAVQLARASDAQPAPAKCPQCDHDFDVEQLPAARDLQGLLRELRMTLKKEDEGDGDRAALLLQFLRGGQPGGPADADRGDAATT